MDIDFQAILQVFAVEADEHLAVMEDALLALEARPDDAESLYAVFRAAHTLKGDAGNLGFAAVAEFAHVMEDLLDRLRDGLLAVSPDVCALLLAAVDALRTAVPAALAGADALAPEHTALMARIAAAAEAADASDAAPLSPAVRFASPPPNDAIGRSPAADEPAARSDGSLSTGEPTSFDGSASFDGSLSIGGSAAIDGSAAFDGWISFDGSTSSDGSKSSDGLVSIDGSISIGGAMSFDGSASSDGSNPADGAAGASRLAAARARGRTLRVDVEKLDRTLDLVGEIAIARGRLAQMAEEGRPAAELLEAHREADRLHVELQEVVMKLRMVPLGPMVRPFARTVRDVAAAHGKEARLVVHGAEVEMDTSVVEQLREPLTHMVRNAVDHGIEPPEARRAAGKDPRGTVTLSACHDGSSIVIEMRDDGAGLSRERIAARARAAGLAADPERMSDAELFRLVFEPGFSTADHVTDLSGRGVGLDVVRRAVDALRGTLDVHSRPGEGTAVTLRLPLTLAVIEGFSVGVAGQTYVIPLDAVVECLELPRERHARGAHGMISLRGEALPFLRLRDHLGATGLPPRRESVVVVRHAGGRAGLVVDALLGGGQAVIKPLGRLFRDLPGVSGSTILGSGRVALILDVASLIREALQQQARAAAA